MKHLPIFLFFTLLSVNLAAQTNDSTIRIRLIIRFHSVCCGVPSAEPLNLAIGIFKDKYKIKKLKGVKIGPLGREGEYALGFGLNEMTPTKRKKFIGMIKELVPSMKDKGNATYELDALIVKKNLPRRATFEDVEY